MPGLREAVRPRFKGSNLVGGAEAVLHERIRKKTRSLYGRGHPINKKDRHSI